MAALGRRPFLVPNHKIMDGINGVRQLLPCCWFDEARCRDGLEALRQYQTEWSDKDRCFRDTPKHDWTSHAADAFRYWVGPRHLHHANLSTCLTQGGYKS
jgi:hypothetical protein